MIIDNELLIGIKDMVEISKRKGNTVVGLPSSSNHSYFNKNDSSKINEIKIITINEGDGEFGDGDGDEFGDGDDEVDDGDGDDGDGDVDGDVDKYGYNDTCELLFLQQQKFTVGMQQNRPKPLSCSKRIELAQRILLLRETLVSTRTPQTFKRSKNATAA